jgi:Fe2+ transport system protein FeoA
MTLWELARHQRAIVDKFLSTIDPKYVQRLQDLGLRTGEEVRCVRRSLLGGPRVYQVGGNFVAVEKYLAKNITVVRASVIEGAR